MDNNLVRLKLKQRLNKLASSDYTNLECWQEAEVLNKAQIGIVRRNLHGGNQYREGDEQSTTRVDDFQILLVEKELKGSNKGKYFETDNLPNNYLKFKRIRVSATNKSCPTPRDIKVSLAEEANINDLLNDYLLKPSFKWAETIATLVDNKIRVYTLGDFAIKDINLIYYRMPRQVSFEGCRDWNNEVAGDITFEFKDDLIELIIDEAAAIAAADMNDFNNYQRQTQKVESNN